MNKIKTVTDSNSNKDVCSNPEYKELVIRLKNGDSQAYASLFCLHKDELLRYLLRLTNSIEDSEDIVQDVFIKVWLDRENIDEQKNFKSYIFKIAHNLAIDKLRKRSQETHSPVQDIDFSSENSEKDLLRDEKHQICQEALNSLPTQQQKICRLRFEEEKNLDEIAQELNISVSTVQNTINQGKKNMREYLAKKSFF